MTSRGYGRGSIYLRADGLWIGRIEVSATPRQRLVISGKDRSDVERRMDDWLATNRPRQAEPRPIGNREVHMARARSVARHTAAEWRAKEAAANGLCHYCKRHVSVGGVKDHVQPVSRGGSDGIDNVVLACWDCNAAKSDLSADEFLAWAAETGFFTQAQRITVSTGKRNRRIPPEAAALMRIPRSERVALSAAGTLRDRIQQEMEQM